MDEIIKQERITNLLKLSGKKKEEIHNFIIDGLVELPFENCNVEEKDGKIIITELVVKNKELIKTNEKVEITYG